MTVNQPESAALDNAEAAIIEGKEQVADQRAAALSAADSASERDAINGRFDTIEARFDALGEQVTAAASAAVGPIGEQLRGMDERIAALGAGGAALADDDDGILSIEEIADDAGDTVDAATDAAVEGAGEVAAEIDKAPARGHVLFRKLWGG